MACRGSVSSPAHSLHPLINGSPTESGQGLVEYALGLVLVGMVAMVGLIAVGPAIQEVYCDAIYAMSPSAVGDCAGLMTGPKINKAKYNSGKNELQIVAKAPYNCSGDLIIAEYGIVLEHAGGSWIHKTIEITGTPPTTVTVGSDSCGWTTVAVS